MSRGYKATDGSNNAESRRQYLKTAMTRQRVTAQVLADRTGISKRTIEGYTSGRYDLADAAGVSVAKISMVLNLKVFALCKTMTYHPYFLYGFRPRNEYREYFENIQNKRKKNLIRREVFNLAQNEYHKRLEADGFDVDEEDWFL